MQILDASGRPMVPAAPRQLAGAGPRALHGASNAPYDAADLYGQGMAAWTPYLWSPDSAINPWRDRIVSRARDLVQNDGWAAGGVTRILDNVVGANLRPISKPDWRSLAEMTGNDNFNHEWAKKFASAIDAHWRAWAEDPGFYCDAGRVQTFTQMMRVAFRHKLVDGDALAVMKHLPRRVGRGRARYATAVQLVDPDRLSNPNVLFDAKRMRGGVEVDPDDEYAVVAYHIRKAHQGDWWSAGESLTWERVPRETRWGRAIVVHDFEGERAGQHRGVGILTPVIARLKMLTKYDGAELDAATINAIFSAYIESPFDHQLVAQAMGDDADTALDGAPVLNQYQANRSAFHNERRIMLGGARIPTLYPGEKINTVNATRPASNFAAFESSVLRNIASGMGITTAQLTNNWADANYSSMRASLMEFFKTLHRRRTDFGHRFCDPVRSAVLEEIFAVEALPMPSGVVPDFIDARAAYGRCRWQGPARGVIDSVQERQGSILALNGSLSTLEDECAEQGLDMEEVIEQRRYEIELMEEAKIPLPAWAGGNPLEAIKKPGLDDNGSKEGADK